MGFAAYNGSVDQGESSVESPWKEAGVFVLGGEHATEAGECFEIPRNGQ